MKDNKTNNKIRPPRGLHTLVYFKKEDTMIKLFEDVKLTKEEETIITKEIEALNKFNAVKEFKAILKYLRRF